MPIQIVDPATPAQGSLPGSPIAGAFTNALGALGRSYPTEAERARMQLEQTGADLNRQKLAQPGSLADAVASAYGAVPEGTKNPDGTPMNHDQWTQNKLPDLLRSGIEPSQLGGLFRTVLLNSPAGASRGNQANAQMGAGDAYTSSREGMQAQQTAETNRQIAVQHSANQGAKDLLVYKQEHGGMTDEIVNRNAKIKAIMDANGLSGPEGTKKATNIVDGVVEGGLDPVTKQPYVINKLDIMNGSPGAGPQDAAAAPALPDFPVATSDDVSINFNKIYGGDSAVEKLGNMAGAVMGNKSTAGTSPEMSKANDFKAGYLAIEGQHPGFRNNATAQGLTINQLPDTGSITSPDHIAQQALVNPKDAAEAYTLALNNVIQMRKTDTALISDTTKPPEERVAAQNRIRDEDNFILKYASQAVQEGYSTAAGLPKAPTPQTNQQKLKAATVVQSKAPSRAEFQGMRPGTKFTDANGVLWQKQADGTAQKVK